MTTAAGTQLPTAVRLGRFELDAHLGSGGMGDVWAGTHPPHGVPVAVKVIGSRRASDPRFRAAFRREVRAVAALAHPGVVRVYDYGEVPESAAQASRGGLSAGSPYLVMERLPGPSLSTRCGALEWREMRRVLLQLLEALAHAHARDVLHRDIKPSNVLLAGAEQVVLTDFGLAHIGVPEPAAEAVPWVAGTPAYMAPEQLAGRYRDEGPWTDLYALGCLCYAVANGRPPFAGRTFREMREAHLYSAPPPLGVVPQAPPGLDLWVARLMAKDLTQRFRHAADAAAGLRALGESEATPRISSPPHPAAAEVPSTATVGSLLASFAPDMEERRHETAPSDGTLPRPALAKTAVPPRWPADELLPQSLHLISAGLGLFGLRPVPIVGRADAQLRLWRALRAVATEGSARAVVIEGPAGVGKTRLGLWLCQQARELGVADVLSVSSSEGLADTVAQSFRAHDLAATDVLARVELGLQRLGTTDAYLSRALASLVSYRATKATGAQVRPSLQARNAALCQWFEWCCVHRNLILMLDDVHTGTEAIELAESLLERQAHAPFPALLVLTAQEGGLRNAPDAARMLRALARRPEVSHMPLGPLPGDQWSALVGSVLRLDDRLAAEVEERTSGNPLFVVHLLGDWVHRNVLVPATNGFTLRPDADAELHRDVYRVWESRIDEVLSLGESDSDRAALELAAALGREVDSEEWAAVLYHHGLQMPRALVERLLDRRLLEPIDRGFAFSHGMLREAILREAADGGRSATLHRCCAAVLKRRAGPAISERLAEHLVAAGERAAAVEPLQRAARHHIAGDVRRVERLLDRRDEILGELETPASASRWGEGWCLRASANVVAGRVEEAERWATRALEAADEHGWSDVRAEAARCLGTAAMLRAYSDEAAHWLEVAIEQVAQSASPSPDARIVGARALLRLGQLHRARGRLDEAGTCFRRSLGMHPAETEAQPTEDAGDHLVTRAALHRGLCLKELATIDFLSDDRERCRAHVEEAAALFERIGAAIELAACSTLHGMLASAEGRPERAEGHFRQAARGFQATGSWINALISQTNLALAFFDQDRFQVARGLLESCLQRFELLGNKHMACAVHVDLLPCLAKAADWSSFDRHVGRAAEQLAALQLVDPDTARMAARAGDVAREAGEGERAAVAYRIARDQWRAIGRVREVAQVEAALKALGLN